MIEHAAPLADSLAQARLAHPAEPEGRPPPAAPALRAESRVIAPIARALDLAAPPNKGPAALLEAGASLRKGSLESAHGLVVRRQRRGAVHAVLPEQGLRFQGPRFYVVGVHRQDTVERVKGVAERPCDRFPVFEQLPWLSARVNLLAPQLSREPGQPDPVREVEVRDHRADARVLGERRERLVACDFRLREPPRNQMVLRLQEQIVDVRHPARNERTL